MTSYGMLVAVDISKKSKSFIGATWTVIFRDFHQALSELNEITEVALRCLSFTIDQLRELPPCQQRPALYLINALTAIEPEEKNEAGELH